MSTMDIIGELKEIRCENTFNPYFERCHVYDEENAPEMRCNFLTEILERAARAELDAIWVGRDLGYRGGRRTGLALTDDVHLHTHLRRWNLPTPKLSRKPVAERTAAVIWEVLNRIEDPIFLWNIFPLHPFLEGDTFSNRAHNARERRAGTAILIKLVKYLKPRRVIAIGNDAYNVLSEILSADVVTKVRHPSYGGQKEFLAQIRSIYDCEETVHQADLFSIEPAEVS
ncbi:MAG: uracil-DNA glycosylase [Alphaproteobacteria bacterium]|nr:uracil-DNA glycosylase [Alphaproteobacteria bacterium]